jgi:hypothetical protein
MRTPRATLVVLVRERAAIAERLRIVEAKIRVLQGQGSPHRALASAVRRTQAVTVDRGRHLNASTSR